MTDTGRVTKSKTVWKVGVTKASRRTWTTTVDGHLTCSGRGRLKKRTWAYSRMSVVTGRTISLGSGVVAWWKQEIV